MFSEHVLGAVLAAVLGLPCGAWALRCHAQASLVVAHGLSCPGMWDLSFLNKD